MYFYSQHQVELKLKRYAEKLAQRSPRLAKIGKRYRLLEPDTEDESAASPRRSSSLMVG
jgi:hypothetical protein